MRILLKILRICLQIVYAPLKLFPVNTDKILFLSRQSDELTLDFRLLQEELSSRDRDIKFVTICRRSSDSRIGTFLYAFSLLKSMYHLATSSVCVIDSYWPAVCMLNHKDSLTVIQIWHALGKIKQSGYQILDKAGGRGRIAAEELRMHRNYDYIIAGGRAWNQFYCASFNTTPDKLVNIGLPRIDYLLETEDSNREKIFLKYPQFRDKTVLLYAPTFRKGIEANWHSLIDVIDPYKYILIVKGHPNQPLFADSPWVYTCDEFKAVDLLSVCDYLITDYSAIAVEGAILNRKTFYYVYDYDEYTSANGTNIRLFDEMPGCVFRDASEIAKALEKPYRQDCLDNYRKKYLPQELGTSTSKLADLILEKKGQQDV